MAHFSFYHSHESEVMEKIQRGFPLISHLFFKHILKKNRSAPSSNPKETPLPPNARMARDIGLTESTTERMSLRFPSDDYHHPML